MGKKEQTALVKSDEQIQVGFEVPIFHLKKTLIKQLKIEVEEDIYHMFLLNRGFQCLQVYFTVKLPLM